jgi:hypothetical protein
VPPHRNPTTLSATTAQTLVVVVVVVVSVVVVAFVVVVFVVWVVDDYYSIAKTKNRFNCMSLFRNSEIFFTNHVAKQQQKKIVSNIKNF